MIFVAGAESDVDTELKETILGGEYNPLSGYDVRVKLAVEEVKSGSGSVDRAIL